jgi:5-methylcytosine-specific restriction endonuclease McrA
MWVGAESKSVGDAMNIYNKNEVERWIRDLIDKDDLHGFYGSKYWVRLRKEVLIEYKYECQHCKAKGLYTKANHVHHVQYVRKHPRDALSKTYIYEGKEYKNLIPLCKACHDEIHDYKKIYEKEPLTKERW